MRRHADRQARPHGPTRRQLLAAAGLGAAGLSWVASVRLAGPGAAEMEAAIREFVGEAQVRPGKVTLDIPGLVENGNAVPMTVAVESPMTAEDHVKAIAVFNEKNPQPHVAVFHLGPRAGRAAVATRGRLANSHTITAVAAVSGGSFWAGQARGRRRPPAPDGGR